MTVRSQRLYELVDLPRVGQHRAAARTGSGGDGLCLHLRLAHAAGENRRRWPSDDHGTVLVVDDEPTIVEVVARYLERAGFAVERAMDGPEALRLAELHRPDLVVLDVMLPGFDGIEVLRRLHERPGKRVAVILLTARGEESDRLIGLRHGADDYVVKPFSPAELVARVEAVLRRVAPPSGEEDGRSRRSSTGRCGSSRRRRRAFLDGERARR